MTRPTRALAPLALPLLVLPLLAAGCGTAPAGAAAVQAAHSSDPAGPPEAAAMVCGDEIRGKVQQALALPAAPATSSTWAGGVFTCRYALPDGPMVLTVQVLPDAARAGARLDADRAGAADAHPLDGLGQRAFGTPAGTAVVLKDAQILTVDTTALPAVFGVHGERRADLAYEVASDVMGCWTGDDGS